jgi:YD repeat-containing protein
VYTNDPHVTIQNDAAGCRTVVQDATETTRRTYDPWNRVTQMVVASGKAITYDFDAAGRREITHEPGGGLFAFSYDEANPIVELVNSQPDRTSFSYNEASQRTLTGLANGTRALFVYDADSRTTSLYNLSLYNLKSDDSVISSFDYDYDAVDNRTSVLEADGARVTWSYDAASQLIGEARSGANAYDHSSQFDPLGNRLVKNEDGAITTSTYDAANQLETSVDSTGTTNYTFDAAGNQQVIESPDGTRTTYTWSYENQPTQVENGSGVIQAAQYNADNRRVRKET